MSKTCISCQDGLAVDAASVLCADCRRLLAQSADRETCRRILDRIDDPILLMQADPRLVFTANEKALSLFGKTLDAAEGHRGGEVFSCIHSFTELGCGKDEHCNDCKIKTAIVAGLEGTNNGDVSSTLTIRQEKDIPYRLSISTENIEKRAMVRVLGFDREA
jgi:hypothetical protein